MPDYSKQRPKVTVPHIPIGALRGASNKTLEEVCKGVSEELGKPFTRGALSAIENGHRGASLQVLAALEVVYGLRPGDITTSYEPRTREAAVA